MKYAAVLILLLGGCTGWRTAANRSINGARSLARSSEAFELRHCGEPAAIVASCKAAGDAKCAKLAKCEVFAKSLLSFNVAILVAQHALIQTAAHKETVQALVLAALKSYMPIRDAIGAWR